MFESDNSSPRSSVETACVVRRRRLELPLVSAAAFVSAMLAGPVILANPTGGVVVRGSADIKTYPERVTVQQHSDKTVINWNGFSIEGGEVTRFKQPGKDSIALNRVITNQPSRIDGLLRANGNVWLVNQNGVTIGPGGKVRAQGFLATTSDIADNDFMDGDGRYNFRPSTNHNPNARVVNQGRISVGERGLGALVAPHARNDHLIQGKGSTVVIGGAKTFAVDFYGDGLIHFDTGSPVTQRPEGVDALAENNGMIRVEGGQVLITADAAADIIDKVIKVGGKVQARSAYSDGGEIVLDGGRSGTVAVTGTLDASSAQRSGRGARGGKIDIRGRKLALGKKALLKASGSAGGGDIRIGARGRRGKGPGRNADAVVLASEARIIADATVAGDGGSIVVYGKETAVIDGILTARGGAKGGDGGFIETSAAGTIEIAADVLVDASAPAGKPGLWLIDPRDITIGAPDTPGTTLANTTLVSALEAGNNVEVNTSQAPYGNAADPGAGNITVAADIRPDLTQPVYPSSTQNVTLTLTADKDVAINPGITVGPLDADAGDSMGVTVGAKGSITNNGAIDVSAGVGGAVNLDAGGPLNLAGPVSGSSVSLTGSGQIGGITHSAAGDVTSTSSGITARAVTGDIIMADGTVYNATGDVSLTAAGNIQLGRIDAGTNAITIDAAGGIGDITKSEGMGNENLVGSDISLIAGNAIGMRDPADIDTNADRIDAKITDIRAAGGIFIDETDAVQLGDLEPVIAGLNGAVEVTAGGAITVAQDVTVAGTEVIRLETTNSDLTINTGVTLQTVGGIIRLATGSGTLTLKDVGGASPTRSVVRTANADIELAVDDLIIQNNDLTKTAQIVAGGGNDIVFLPTVGRSIGLGGATGEFQLDDSEIAALDTTGLVRFGTANTQVGEVRIDTADFSAVGGLELFSSGSISDVGAANESASDQLQAKILRLDARTGVGEISNPLNTAAGNSINAQTTSGDIAIAETNAVQLGSTASPGSVSMQVTPGPGGSIKVIAGGPMTVAQNVTTEGSGTIHLQATNSDLIVNTDATIESENGKIRLDTGSGTLTLEDVGDSSPTRSVIRTGNADIELAVNDLTIQNNDPTGTAQIVAGGGKDIVFLPMGSRNRNGQTIARNIGLGGAAGEFRLDDSEIAALETTGLVRFGAADKRVGEVRIDTANFSEVGGLALFSSGSISDGGAISEAAPNQLEAKILRLDVENGIGNKEGNPLNTDVDSLDAQVTSGSIFIDEADDLALGRVEAGSGDISLKAGGAITDKDPVAEGAGNENLVGGAIRLTAGGVIGGNGDADLDTKVDSLDAQVTSGSIFIDEADDLALGRVVAGSGDITLRAGGAITDKDPAAEGANNENLVGGNISLIAGGAIGATGAADIDIAATSLDAQTTTGDIFIEETDDIALGRVVAGTDSDRKDISITAGGAISDADTTPGDEGTGKENLVGGAIRLAAGSDIGAAGDAAIDTAASVSIDAQTTSGDIAIAETNAVQLGGTAPPGVVRVAVTPGPGGSIQVSGSAMTVAQALTTAGGGNIRLRTTTGNLQVDQAITAGGELNLEAADLLGLAAAVSGGGNVTLTGGTGIGHTAAGDVTTGGTLNATATSGDVGMAEGTLYSAGGAVTLTAQRDVQLGRIEAGTNPITITAVTGAITDDTVAEGSAGNANLIGGAVTLRAGTGIGFGTPRDADIDVVMNGVVVEASEVDAQTTSGGIFINVPDEITPPEPEIPEPEPEIPGPEPEIPGPEPEVPEPEPEVPEPEPETPEPESEIPESNIPDEPPGSEEIEIPDKRTEPEKIPNETIEMQTIKSLEAIDSTSSSVDGLFDSPADIQVFPEYDGVLPDYGVPDYGADEEPDLVHLSGANESLWENQGKRNDEPEVSEEEGSEEE